LVRVTVAVGVTTGLVTVLVGVTVAGGLVVEPPADGADWLAEPPPGDEVPLAGAGDWPLVIGVGVKIDGVGEALPPPVQAETEAASRAAPAAHRPAISHAPGTVRDEVRRVFMNPPRMRVR
jgi:hypothetical protein